MDYKCNVYKAFQELFPSTMFIVIKPNNMHVWKTGTGPLWFKATIN